jgi:hypothetical protein
VGHYCSCNLGKKILTQTWQALFNFFLKKKDITARHAMRDATILAGIDSSDVVIALEPEAATVWCLKIASKRLGNLFSLFFSFFSFY